jgi:hypothetical protein
MGWLNPVFVDTAEEAFAPGMQVVKGGGSNLFLLRLYFLCSIIFNRIVTNPIHSLFILATILGLHHRGQKWVLFIVVPLALYLYYRVVLRRGKKRARGEFDEGVNIREEPFFKDQKLFEQAKKTDIYKAYHPNGSPLIYQPVVRDTHTFFFFFFFIKNNNKKLFHFFFSRRGTVVMPLRLLAFDRSSTRGKSSPLFLLTRSLLTLSTLSRFLVSFRGCPARSRWRRPP